ncbi:MAG TPA: aminodeoxychorismate synthase, component I, partial [Vicinamibacteria bacterium]|nr:aminodeoxychorismate synthase, component I [Vicinamibacteria bacterium]
MTDQPFRLLETLRWTPGEAYVLLDAHLDRLAASARYFGWEGAPARWHTELDRLAAGLRGPSRVRLLV